MRQKTALQLTERQDTDEVKDSPTADRKERDEVKDSPTTDRKAGYR